MEVETTVLKQQQQNHYQEKKKKHSQNGKMSLQKMPNMDIQNI